MAELNKRPKVARSAHIDNDLHSGAPGATTENTTVAPVAQLETAAPLTLIPGKQNPGPDPNANVALNPDFTFVRRDYRVRLASEESYLHTQAGNLVSSMYGSRGLMTARPSFADIQPRQVTLAASSGHHVFGTLTLGMDAGAGLLADSLYRPEIDELRTRGHRLCEVTRLALDPDLSCPEAMATIFNVAFVLASEVHSRTDLLAEVHPRHVGFYRRTMGYRIAGPERICERVSAPAVLMHLCLDFARSQIRQLAGTAAQGERSLYRLFLPAAEQEGLLKKLTAPAPQWSEGVPLSV